MSHPGEEIVLLPMQITGDKVEGLRQSPKVLLSTKSLQIWKYYLQKHVGGGPEIDLHKLYDLEWLHLYKLAPLLILRHPLPNYCLAKVITHTKYCRYARATTKLLGEGLLSYGVRYLNSLS